MNFSVKQKGFVLLAIPLVFHTAFLVVLAAFQREYTAAGQWAIHTKDVISQAKEINATVSGAHASVRGYVISRQGEFLTSFQADKGELPRLLDALARLVEDNAPQARQFQRVRAAAEAAVGWQDGVRELVDGGRADAAADRVQSRQGELLLSAFRRELDAFLDAEERLDRTRLERVEESRREGNALFLAGGIVAVGVTASLALAFQRGIARRFQTLEENTRRLARGEALPPPLAGGDEIAGLDRAFRAMALDLTRAGDRIRDLYDNAPCGYHSVNADGVLVAINKAELRWLGYRADEVVGRKKFADLVAPAFGEVYREAFQRLRAKGEVNNVEIVLARRDGTTFPVLMNSSALCDDDHQFVMSRSTLTDITERKRTEGLVRRMNEELEERVRTRTAELGGVNRELVLKNAENEMFVYSVSHDLRSPLVNLQGFSKELEKHTQAVNRLLDDPAVPAEVRDRIRPLLEGKAAKALGFIQTAVLRLSTIIDALLRLSRAGRVEYCSESVDAAAVAARVVAAAQGTIAQAGATVRVGPLPTVWADKGAVEQVFANLLGNALTYLSPTRPGVIELGALPADGADGPRTFFVRDNGLGIAAAHRSKIFQVFQRAHPGVGSGEGMGLAIVTRIVERHHGRLWVESQVGEGSVFYFTLPVPPTTGPEPGRPGKVNS